MTQRASGSTLAGMEKAHSTEEKAYSTEELARRSGVEASYIDQLHELGVLRRKGDAPGSFSATDVRRVSIVRSLEEGGLPLSRIGEGIRTGWLSLDFVEQTSYERFAALSGESFSEVAERTSLPLELVMVIREATGSAQPSPDDLLRDNELEILPMLELVVAHGVRPAAMERALRGYGDGIRRVADTESGWWRSDVIEPVLRAGKPFGMVGELTATFATELVPLADRAILALYHGHQANAWMRNIFEGVEMALASAGLHSRLEHPPAICFLDLTGYTRLTDERGDEAAADLARRLSGLVQGTSGRYGGRPVKWLGDGVMFYFREPGPAVRAALEMVQGATNADLPPAHVGLDAGPVLFQGGDYFGRTVNLAARIADYARPGEVVVSHEVVEASDGGGVTFSEIGPVELKGVTGPVRLHVAHRST